MLTWCVERNVTQDSWLLELTGVFVGCCDWAVVRMDIKRHTPRRSWHRDIQYILWSIWTPLNQLVWNITTARLLKNVPPPSPYTPFSPSAVFWKKNVREEKSEGKSAVPGAGGGENLISSGVLQWVGYWGGCNLIRRGNSMDCEQVSSLRPVTFLMWCGGGGGDSGGRGEAREEARQSARGKEGGREGGQKNGSRKRGEWGSLTLAAFPFLHGNRKERRSNMYLPQVRLSLGQSQRHIPRLMVHTHQLDHV